jgi:hypothetical protein
MDVMDGNFVFGTQSPIPLTILNPQSQSARCYGTALTPIRGMRALS